MSETPRALLVDFGGVLTTSTVTASREWCAASGITYRQFVGPLITPPVDGGPSLIERLETGVVAVGDFETELGAAIVAESGVEVDLAGFVHNVIGAAGLDDQMLAVVDDARRRDLCTGILSNSWGTAYPMELLGPHFDDVVISGEVGLRKPDRRIYGLAAERIGVPPERCVFVDDLKANVTAAEQVGMTGILHTDAVSTRAALQALLARPTA